jgi:hypothetical protein
MTQLSAKEYELFGDDLEREMPDECQILTYTKGGSKNAYGYTTAADTYPVTATLPCIYTPSSGREVMPSSAQILVSDATVVLPRRAVIKHTDRVTITKQYGQPLAEPIRYKVSGAPRVLIGSIEVPLERITTGA